MAHVRYRERPACGNPGRGFTLVELMIVVAIIALLGAISIPLYNNYVESSSAGATRSNAEALRLALEDHFLDFNTYEVGDWIPDGAQTLETGPLGWHPDGDQGNYNYNVAVGPTGAITSSYVLTVTSRSNTNMVTTCTRNQTAGTFACETAEP